MGYPSTDSLPFALMLLVASVPVALPATFTLASTLGARELASNGVLVTRLTAIEEAAAMDVLCSDKTGTITRNRLTLSAIFPNSPHTEDDVLRLAAISSDEASQDPIDLAILKAARERRPVRKRTGAHPIHSLRPDDKKYGGDRLPGRCQDQDRKRLSAYGGGHDLQCPRSDRLPWMRWPKRVIA